MENTQKSPGTSSHQIGHSRLLGPIVVMAGVRFLGFCIPKIHQWWRGNVDSFEGSIWRAIPPKWIQLGRYMPKLPSPLSLPPACTWGGLELIAHKWQKAIWKAIAHIACAYTGSPGDTRYLFVPLTGWSNKTSNDLSQTFRWSIEIKKINKI